MIVKVNSENFNKEVLQSEIPVIVDFWASWCMPCRMLAGELDALDSKFNGKVKIAKVNVDEEELLAVKHNVSAIPLVVLYKNGNVTKTHVGYTTASDLIKEFEL